MKTTIYCLCGMFSITTASATVYDGAYTGNINVTENAFIEKDSVFDGASIRIGPRKTLTVSDNVRFINGTTLSSSYTSSPYFLNLMGNNIFISGGGVSFVSNGSGSIPKLTISGNDILFDSNTAQTHPFSYSYPYGFEHVKTGGAIFVSNDYNHSHYQPIVTINGKGTRFVKNDAQHGGGIFNYAATIIGNAPVEFDGNTASYNGGAIYNAANRTRGLSATLYIAPGSVFTGNVAHDGGAIYNGGSYAKIGADTIFRGNVATNGGAIFNADANAQMEIDTGTSAVHFETASDSIYNSGGIINFLGTGQIDAGQTRLTSVRGDQTTNRPVINLGKTSAVFDTVTLQDNTILKTTVWADGMAVKNGNLSANTFNIQNNDELKLQIAVENRNILSPDGSVVTILTDRSGTQDAGWDYFGNADKYPKFIAQNNRLYDITFISDGVYKITPKADAPIDPNAAGNIMDGAANAWNMAGFQSGSVAESIANQLHILAQFDDTLPEYTLALDAVVPERVGIINHMISNNTSANLRFLSRRMNGGKPGFWASGGYKMLDNGDTYTGHTLGGTFGQDIAFLNGMFTLGQAFGYSRTNIDSDVRTYDINNSFDLSLYGNLNLPIGSNDLYFSAIVSHGAYSVTESKNVFGYGIDSEFDATQTSAQTNIGLRHGVFGGDLGYRYNYISHGAYTDTIGQGVSSMDAGISHALANLYIMDNDGVFQWGTYVGGEFAIGKSEFSNIATAPNGQRYKYTIKSDNSVAFVFGANVDLTLSARITLGVVYNGLIAGDYSEHAGKLRFNWAW